MNPKLKRWLPVAIVVALAVWALARWGPWATRDEHPGFVTGNGRIEATEVDVATKIAGRVGEILVHEGDFVQAGQDLATMDTRAMQAQRDEAVARQQQTLAALDGARAEVALRESDHAAAAALVDQRASDLDAARRRLARSELLAREGAASLQDLDDDRARVSSSESALAAAKAQANSAASAINAARTEVASARANEKAAQASVNRIDSDLADAVLRAPIAGRVQYRVAEPGEVLAAGGKVLNLIDLSDVYMTFFVPETLAGRVALGAEVRIVLDALPAYAIPATVSYVASTAQFTPKTVETADERQKLMFRVKARIAPALLRAHLRQVKTGLPGVAWLRLDPKAPWPPEVADKAVP